MHTSHSQIHTQGRLLLQQVPAARISNRFSCSQIPEGFRKQSHLGVADNFLLSLPVEFWPRCLLLPFLSSHSAETQEMRGKKWRSAPLAPGFPHLPRGHVTERREVKGIPEEFLSSPPLFSTLLEKWRVGGDRLRSD